MQLTKLPERNLDTLRAIAVGLVVGQHWQIFITGLPVVWPGAAGVRLFFVHTALVLMASLERGGDDAGWVRRFYVRRAFRLYPLAWAAIGLVLLLKTGRATPFMSRPSSPWHSFTMPELIGNITLTQNLAGVDNLMNVLWTLPVEIQMYLMLPICWLLARRGSGRVAALYIVGVALAIVFGLALVHVKGVWRLSTLSYVPCFVPGIAAYALLRRKYRPVLPSWTWIPLIGGAVLVLTPISSESPLNAAGWSLSALIGVVLPFVAEPPKSLLTRVSHQVAKYSYGVYLLHIPALWISVLYLGDAPLTARWAAILTLTVALPVLAYHVLEAPFIRLGNKVVHRRDATTGKEDASTVTLPPPDLRNQPLQTAGG